MKEYFPIRYTESPLDSPKWLKWGYLLCVLLAIALFGYILYNEWFTK